METSIAGATAAAVAEEALQAPARQTRRVSGTNIIFRFVEQLFEIGEMSIIYYTFYAYIYIIILRPRIKMTSRVYGSLFYNPGERLIYIYIIIHICRYA